MNKQNKIKLAQAIVTKQKANAKRDYYSYVKYTHRDMYSENRHGQYVSEVIENALNRRIRMLNGEIKTENQYIMLSIPPRHGKSMHISETLPSYFMQKFPKSKVILTAYSTTLANDFDSANTKKTKEDNVFGVQVVTSNQDRTKYDNGSECIKAGILGGITGKGAHLMIIDDPIKTSEEARSEVHRDKVWKEWTASLSTRLEEAAIVIVIMTRWHEDDLCGRLLNPEYGKPLPWTVINLPLEAEENDLLGRKPGEPLWAERYGYDFIEMRKAYPEEFNALYQGRPTSAEGNMIKKEWFESDDKWYSKDVEYAVTCMSVDATFKDTSKSDKVAIQVWSARNNKLYLRDGLDERMDFLSTLQAIRNYKEKYPEIGMIFIEDKANGSAIINVLNKELLGICPVNPLGGKEARVQSVLPYLQANVILPKYKAFVKPMLEEWYSFPNGTHDDTVDAMSQALSQMIHYYSHIFKVQPTIIDSFFNTPPENDDTLAGDFY